MALGVIRKRERRHRLSEKLEPGRIQFRAQPGKDIRAGTKVNDPDEMEKLMPLTSGKIKIKRTAGKQMTPKGNLLIY